LDEGTPLQTKFWPTLGNWVVDSILEHEPMLRLTPLPETSVIWIQSLLIPEITPLPLFDPAGIPPRHEKSLTEELLDPDPDPLPLPLLATEGYPNFEVHI
jgi:hypothetical protein